MLFFKTSNTSWISQKCMHITHLLLNARIFKRIGMLISKIKHQLLYIALKIHSSNSACLDARTHKPTHRFGRQAKSFPRMHVFGMERSNHGAVNCIPELLYLFSSPLLLLSFYFKEKICVVTLCFEFYFPLQF